MDGVGESAEFGGEPGEFAIVAMFIFHPGMDGRPLRDVPWAVRGAIFFAGGAWWFV